MQIANALLSKAPSSPPTEFRLFKAGWNETSKGRFLFDSEAAASVMARYRRGGVELMIDLEHGSLDAPTRSDSADARGWFKLALRGGDLWAVGVTWTSDGARRLSDRTQRYISPAFSVDSKTNRVTEILNAAIVAMPATYGATMVAASRLTRTGSAVIGARVTHAQAEAFKALAQRSGVKPGRLLRGFIALAANTPDPVKGLAAIAKILGLPVDLAPDDVLKAVTELVNALNSLEAAQNVGTPEVTDPLAAGPGSSDASAYADESLSVEAALVTQLNAAAITACKRSGLTLGEFVRNRARVVRCGDNPKPDALKSLLKVLKLPANSTVEEVREKAMTHTPMSDVAAALGKPNATPEQTARMIAQLLANAFPTAPWWDPAVNGR